jgi:tRNA G18 (ribose-2'-O)-methylase SpoU
METVHITSPDDPHVEHFRAVRDRDAMGTDGRPGLFVGESPLVIEAMFATGTEVLSLLTAARNEARAVQMVHAGLRAGAQPPTVVVAPDEVLDAIVGFNIHRGFLAVARRPRLHAPAELVAPAGNDSLLLCIEEVNNIDNIGQLFRNAAAFGCSGVLLSPGCHDPLYRKSVRVSCGCVLKVPFARSGDWEADLRALRDNSYALVAATGRGSQPLADVAARLHTRAPGAHRTAVLVGAEFAGLRDSTLALAGHRARIPMAPGVDSLNVAVAAAVFLDRLRFVLPQ